MNELGQMGRPCLSKYSTGDASAVELTKITFVHFYTRELARLHSTFGSVGAIRSVPRADGVYTTRRFLRRLV
jgi:hypothetical protein